MDNKELYFNRQSKITPENKNKYSTVKATPDNANMVTVVHRNIDNPQKIDRIEDYSRIIPANRNNGRIV